MHCERKQRTAGRETRGGGNYKMQARYRMRVMKREIEAVLPRI
jgi:hypothetical protein